MDCRTTVLAGALALALWSAASRAEEADAQRRLSPADIEALPRTTPGAGTSGLAGIQTRVLKGDPARSGLYTIQLTVPPNTRIEAHDHPDDRVVTVVSGTWSFGYGTVFDEAKLKKLGPGSFYTEPPAEPHFARTDSAPVVVHISGFGPTGTRYVGGKGKP
jgi:quercetin dioxygenase-like cupin family protein